MARPIFRAEQVHPSAFIAEGAVVVGDVTIGEDSSVWFNVVMRGDVDAIRIGDRTNVQDGTVLHADEGLPCEIGNDVTIGHNAIVHGCTIEDNVLIGMGSVVMNGAVIGSGSIVGVGAVVTEGTIVPPKSLVLGLPAKVIREVSEKDVERIKHAAAHYVENARRYSG
jgi:carbonic anhydrase/acetyltransferase-like protein (isoleucine patch superfamily)